MPDDGQRWSFRLADAGRDVVRDARRAGPRSSADLLREVIVPACRADVLLAAAPYRLWHAEFEARTDFSLVAALLGLYDAELRAEPLRVNPSGFPSYGVCAVAAELVLLNEAALVGQARPSLDQARRIYEPADHYAVAERAMTLADAAAANVAATVGRRGDVTIHVAAISTDWGSFDHTLFVNRSGGTYDEPETLELFECQGNGSALTPVLQECSEAMRDAFGFGVEALFHLCHLSAEVFRRFRNQNLVFFTKQEFVEQIHPGIAGPDPDEVENALQLLVLDPAILPGWVREAPLMLPTGPAARLVTRPLVKFGPDHLATTPELVKRASVQLLRHMLDGRLPNGAAAKPKTPLAVALDHLRQDRTGGFEQSVRQSLATAGFAVAEVSDRGPITAQIDAVAVDHVAQKIWIISVKDPFFAFRPQQAMEQLERFFEEYLPQVDRNLAEVDANRGYIWTHLRRAPNGEDLPSLDPGWPLHPMFVFRDVPPAVGIAGATPDLPHLVLRRDLGSWRPGDDPPTFLNPPVAF